MKIKFNSRVSTTALERQRTGCIVVGVYEKKRLSVAAQQIDMASGKYISKLLRRGDMTGHRDSALLLHNVAGVAADRVLLLGCGKAEEMDPVGYHGLFALGAKRLAEAGVKEALICLMELAMEGYGLEWKVRQAVIAMSGSLYCFDEFKSKRKEGSGRTCELVFPVLRQDRQSVAQGLAQGEAIANGIALTRDLANRPANVCTPAHLARQARQMARQHRSLQVDILGEAEMKKLGMNSLLSVSKGSHESARLISLSYKKGKRRERPIVLVGKGVTFDTGGISLKPAPAMDEMKFDMCGAAAVLGVLRAVAELGLPINLIGLIPATENMPGSRASKPGDIVTSLSGQTIEILNTDAEGRLILCDALTYSARFNPGVVIDIATLTGACVIALGQHATGLMGNYQPLVDGLLNAGQDSGDRAWQLPLWKEYKRQLDSPFADMANIGGRNAGTITAASFLSNFTEPYRWAHLDIAGTAWRQGKDKGATGRPVGLLMQYMLEQCG